MREARQQQFISDARSQVGVGSLFRNRTQLLRIFGASVRTDISSTKSILGLLKLVAESSGQAAAARPAAGHRRDGRLGRRRGHAERDPRGGAALPRRPGQPEGRRAAPHGPQGAALAPQPPAPPRRAARPLRQRAARARRSPPGSRSSSGPGCPSTTRKLMTSSGSYQTTDSRSYTIRDRSGKPHKAYRIVAYEGHVGQYYGVQGTTLAVPAGPRRPVRDPDGAGPQAPALLRRLPPAPRRLEDRQGVVLGREHAPAAPSRRSRCSPWRAR